MTDISSVSSTLSQYDIENKQTEETSSNELGKTEFLELMIAKLNNQDPLNPQDDAQFIAELAQFSTVEGIQNMSDGFDELSSTFKSSHALQASSLVGGAVTIEGNSSSTLRIGELVYGTADIPAGADDLRLQIEDSTGQVIEDVELGYQANGELTFKWDGANLEVNGELMDIDYSKFEQDESGSIIPHAGGEYSFAIRGNVLGQAEVFDLSMSDRVDSVTILSDDDIQLNLASGDTATMAQVKQINSVY